MINKLGIFSFHPFLKSWNRSLWVEAQGNYGGDFIPKDIKDYYDIRLVRTRFIANAMKFSSQLLELSKKVIDGIRDVKVKETMFIVYYFFLTNLI